MVESVRLLRQGLTEIYHCAGNNNRCSYLYDAITQSEIMPPGVDELPIPEAAAFIRRSRDFHSGESRSGRPAPPDGDPL